MDIQLDNFKIATYCSEVTPIQLNTVQNTAQIVPMVIWHSGALAYVCNTHYDERFTNVTLVMFD